MDNFLTPYENLGWGGNAEWGQATADELQEVRKALSAGYDMPPTSGGGAVRQYDLEGTVKWATFTEQHAKLWRALTKSPAISTVAEYTRIDDLGTSPYSAGFIGETGTALEDDATLQRLSMKIKYVAVKRSVTLPLQFSQVIGPDANANAFANRLGMREMIRRIEYALFFGDDTLNTLSWQGLRQQIVAESATTSDVVYDAGGNPLDKDSLQDITDIIHDNFGLMTSLFLGTKAKGDLKKSLFPSQRAAEAYSGGVGFNFDQWMRENIEGASETAKVDGHVLLRPGRGLSPLATAKGPSAPAAPTSVTLAAASEAGLDMSGTYFYEVSSVGPGGESAKTSPSGSVTPTAAQRVDITINSTDATITHFRIYRGTVDGSETFVTEVARSGAAVIHQEKNEILPGTSEGFALAMDGESVYMRQLAPIFRRDLPWAEMTQPFVLLAFLALIVATPKKCVYIKNIGRA